MVDGDDVWPALEAADLHQIAAIDRQIEQRERSAQRPLPQRAFDEAGGAIYSFAERVRHYRGLVADLERGAAQDYQLLTELGCRDVVERLLDRLPATLRARLERDLLEPLDQRFAAATIDDGGAFLRSRFESPLRSSWRWTRRPNYLFNDEAAATLPASGDAD